MKWKYHSENIGGNLHGAAKYISDNHPEWDVVAMDHHNMNTVVVWREEIVVPTTVNTVQKVLGGKHDH
jgi:hypothetical protein